MIFTAETLADASIETSATYKAARTVEEAKAKATAIAKEFARKALMGIMFAGAVASMRLPRSPMGGITNTIQDAQDYASFDKIPEVLIGAMPLYCVQRIESSMSDLKVKYRAVGDVFLAHQKGSGRTLRIDGKFIGPYRYLYLIYLLALQESGEGIHKNLDAIGGTGVAGTKKIEVSKDGTYEFHNTLPVITVTDISLDLYIQTIEWNQTIETGGEPVINYSVLFRKYIKHKNASFDKGKKRYSIYYGESVFSRLRYEWGYDILWKLSKISTEVFRGLMFDGKSTLELNRDAVFQDPYVSSIKSVMQGAMSEMYDGVI